MLFRKLELGDADIIRPFFSMQSTRMCDCSVGSVMMWRNFFNTRFAIEDASLFFKVAYGERKETAFTVPICADSAENKRRALKKIKDYCKKNNIPPMFCMVAGEEIDTLREVFGALRAVSERDWSDYLYNASDLATFSGRKYNGQRNHLNRFKRLYPQYRFCEIGEECLPLLRNFFERYIEANGKQNALALEENGKVMEVLDNYGAYKLFGGYIAVDDEIIAFSIGEKVNDTLFVHVEKAKTEYHGAYQAIVNEFARRFVSDEIMYINREEDVGDEGLRRSKLSYHPVRLIEKHLVRCF